MSYKEVIKKLKTYGPDTRVTIVLQTEKKSLNEQNWVTGDWNGKKYSFEVNTCWRSGEIQCNEMDVEGVIELLKKRKSLQKISSLDFDEITLNFTSDGDTDYGEIDWSKKLTKAEKEIAPTASDLYWEGNIEECEYSFPKGGLYSMRIECEEYVVTLTE